MNTTIMKKQLFSLLFAVLIIFASAPVYGQFSEPEFEKMTKDQWGWFMNKFDDVKLTGQGLYDNMEIDGLETSEVRARLEALYGEPTKTIEDLIGRENFRPGEAIQFEYWFTVDDSIPLMVLDVDGPFGQGLVYGGASRYIDLMPQIKRTFSQKLMEVENPAEYSDYFYSPEREQWFLVTYENGTYSTEEIESPEGMTIDFGY